MSRVQIGGEGYKALWHTSIRMTAVLVYLIRLFCAIWYKCIMLSVHSYLL